MIACTVSISNWYKFLFLYLQNIINNEEKNLMQSKVLQIHFFSYNSPVVWNIIIKVKELIALYYKEKEEKERVREEKEEKEKKTFL